MKNKIFKSVISVFAVSLFAVTPAIAEEGNATYAVVDSTGLVTNIIVCTASVCGSGGSWGGKMPSDTSCPGCSLVLQVAAHPVTGANQGGVLGGTDKKVTESNGVFTVTNNNPVVTQEVIKETPGSGVVLEASLGSGTKQTFTVQDTIENPGQITFHDAPIDQNVSATLTATQVTIEESTENTETIIPVVTESITFSERQTQETVEAAVNNMPMIKANIIWFMGRLSVWFI